MVPVFIARCPARSDRCNTASITWFGSPISRIVTTSPDVTVSTNLGAFVNQRGLFKRREMKDVFAAAKIASAQKWSASNNGQHIELGIAESNLFLMLEKIAIAESQRFTEPLGQTGLDALLSPYGASVAGSMVIDLRSNQPLQLPGPGGTRVQRPFPLFPITVPVTDHPIVSGLTGVTLAFASPLDLSSADAATVTPLLATTAFGAVMPGESPLDPSLDWSRLVDDLRPRPVAAVRASSGYERLTLRSGKVRVRRPAQRARAATTIVRGCGRTSSVISSRLWFVYAGQRSHLRWEFEDGGVVALDQRQNRLPWAVSPGIAAVEPLLLFVTVFDRAECPDKERVPSPVFGNKRRAATHHPDAERLQQTDGTVPH